LSSRCIVSAHREHLLQIIEAIGDGKSADADRTAWQHVRDARGVRLERPQTSH
jgi:hypothetical protein